MNTNDAITRVWETKANFMDLLCMILTVVSLTITCTFLACQWIFFLNTINTFVYIYKWFSNFKCKSIYFQKILSCDGTNEEWDEYQTTFQGTNTLFITLTFEYHQRAKPVRTHTLRSHVFFFGIWLCLCPNLNSTLPGFGPTLVSLIWFCFQLLNYFYVMIYKRRQILGST